LDPGEEAGTLDYYVIGGFPEVSRRFDEIGREGRMDRRYGREEEEKRKGNEI